MLAPVRASATPAVAADEPTVELLVFHGDGCPHCAAILDFLDGSQRRRPALVVVAHEVWDGAANLALFRDTLAELGEEPAAVPTVVVGRQVIVGHSDAIERRTESVVDDLLAGTLMLTLAIAMLVAPAALETIVGTASVFGIAAGCHGRRADDRGPVAPPAPPTRQQRRERASA